MSIKKQLSTFCPEMDYIIFTIWLIYLSSKGKLKENYFLCVFIESWGGGGGQHVQKLLDANPQLTLSSTFGILYICKFICTAGELRKKHHAWING